MALATQRRTKKAIRKAERRARRRREESSIPIAVAAPPSASVFGLRVVLYLAALTLAEIVTVLVDTRWGVVGHAAVLILLITQAALATYQSGPEPIGPAQLLARRQANVLSALALVPLIRIVSLAMPLAEFPRISWYGLIAIPLLAATWATIRACRYSPADVYLRMGRNPLAVAIQLVVALSGIGLGYLEYRILLPEPLVDQLAPVPVLTAAVVLLIGTGFTEELIFRGVLQRAGRDLFGPARSILLASTLFAVLHIGHRSPVDIGFVFMTAIYFGVVTDRTRSLVGVTIAHGMTNFCLFVLFPHLLGGR